jgi:hypothetical protein
LGTLQPEGSGAARPKRSLAASNRPGMILVRTPEDLQRLERYLFVARRKPVVLLTEAVGVSKPVLPPREVRDLADSKVRIYLIIAGHPLRRLSEVLGRRLAVPRGSARICWPGFSTRSDPADHPLVQRLDGESDQEILEEFATQFDLSRPRVRRELKASEDLRVVAEYELAQVKARLRESQRQRRPPKTSRAQPTRRAEADTPTSTRRDV